MVFEPLKIRLIKYVINNTHYCIGTTLMDKQYSIEALKDVYHAPLGH